MKRFLTTILVILLALSSVSAFSSSLILKTGPSQSWFDLEMEFDGKKSYGAIQESAFSFWFEADMLFDEADSMGLRLGVDFLSVPMSGKINAHPVDVKVNGLDAFRTIEAGYVHKFHLPNGNSIILSPVVFLSYDDLKGNARTYETFSIGLMMDAELRLPLASIVNFDTGLKMGGPLYTSYTITPVGSEESFHKWNRPRGITIVPYIGLSVDL